MLFIKIILLSFLLLSSVHAWDINDFKSEVLSPFSTSAINTVYVGGGLTLAVLLFEDSIVDSTQKEFVDDKPLGSLSKPRESRQLLSILSVSFVQEKALTEIHFF